MKFMLETRQVNCQEHGIKFACPSMHLFVKHKGAKMTSVLLKWVMFSLGMGMQVYIMYLKLCALNKPVSRYLLMCILYSVMKRKANTQVRFC